MPPSRLLLLLAVLACEPPKTPATLEGSDGGAPGAAQHTDACRDDIPDCAAACALRETSRRDFIDFYDRRCAAVILGKNPDKVEPPPVVAGAASQTSAARHEEFPPDSRASLTATHTQFDPTSVTRMGGAEPPECKAARILRAQKRDRDADVLDALCVAKGGDAGT